MDEISRYIIGVFIVMTFGGGAFTGRRRFFEPFHLAFTHEEMAVE